MQYVVILSSFFSTCVFTPTLFPCILQVYIATHTYLTSIEIWVATYFWKEQGKEVKASSFSP